MKKNWFKNTLLFLAFLMILSLNSLSFAQNDDQPEFGEFEECETIDAAPVIGIENFRPDPEMTKLIQEKEELASEYYQAKMSGDSLKMNAILNAGAGRHNTRSNDQYQPYVIPSEARYLRIYQFPQERKDYCGYAAIQSLLDYDRIYRSQTEIADAVYRRDRSCPWYLDNGNSRDQFPVPIYLTRMLGYRYIPFPYGEVEQGPLKVNDVKRKVVYTLDQRYGLMACGKSKGETKNDESILPGYPPRDISHWVVIRGYYDWGDQIDIVDPAKSKHVTFGNQIDAYYHISAHKLAAFASYRGLIW